MGVECCGMVPGLKTCFKLQDVRFFVVFGRDFKSLYGK